MQWLFTIILLWFQGTLYSSWTVLYFSLKQKGETLICTGQNFYLAYDFNQ